MIIIIIQKCKFFFKKKKNLIYIRFKFITNISQFANITKDLYTSDLNTFIRVLLFKTFIERESEKSKKKRNSNIDNFNQLKRASNN